ncbi:PLP-dependent aminotransferase family protein [Salmonella enterica]|uniref:PLP-dependent aminotransferase family protein n=1 Tax=Salmonella enterica TaxID=28901 RepID=A0A5U4HCR4_SALER|nr:PLP-dependent aminotransferase family protein [Salmonella enterica]EBV0440091.1 PLP-dependent aminotransferase family protein [Salmonella enterica subsp. enterica serovar Brandenburg]ECU7927473.1 PLP-dependent aminotransferase family protein [Salmonella enterica subsp. enterica serovar Goldcoast]EAX3102423.1 PLP-dependent aminotransferase family protein [Salmonella enterica]EAX3133817.1 PLP-dependent aminotransferase family protein [Salmonella enterica]
MLNFRYIGPVPLRFKGPIQINNWTTRAPVIDIHLSRSAMALPLYLQIEQQIRWQIIKGRLNYGEYLPPSRELARQLRVSRGSVVRAYEALCVKEYCHSHTGRGTRVIYREKPDASPPGLATSVSPPIPQTMDKFLPGGLSLLPSHASTAHLPVSEFRQAFNRVLRYPDRLNHFGESAGNLELRQLICDQILPSRGISASPREVLIVPGSQYGSLLLAMTVRQERTCFHFGEPGYLEFARNFSRFGYGLQSHRMDAEGIDISGFWPASKDILYLMPEHHFPQCITLSDARRSEIIQLACQKKVLLLEDDYDSEFYFDKVPRPALRSTTAATQVVYMGTFSKVLFNNVRLGYLVADSHLVQQMAALHWSLSRGTSGLLQQWGAELLKSGTYARHLRRMRRVYLHKRDAMVALVRRYLPDAQFSVPSGGLQLYVRFSEPEKKRRIYDWLSGNNIQVADTGNYTFDTDATSDFIVLGFANTDVNECETVFKRLSHALYSDPDRI